MCLEEKKKSIHIVVKKKIYSTPIFYLLNNFYNSPELIISNILQIEILGQLLYSHGAILLIITSFILLLALVTPIILSKI